MSLRFLYLTGLSTHVLACVWYALACKNAASVAAGEAVCREGTWAQHPGTALDELISPVCLDQVLLIQGAGINTAYIDREVCSLSS